ncbi:MAG: hypothetical protein ACRDDK_03515 [Cetobacterium sp.]
MNDTNIKILTLLVQDTFILEELSMYLNLEKSSISKSIKQINIFLEEEKYPKIELKENRYILSLSKKEQEELFNKKVFMTSDEIYDYLYIKFIHNNFINLEEEREKLNLSRSSIFRIFTKVKNNLSENGSKYVYIHGKGIELKYLSPKNLHIFFKALVKYFFKIDFSLNRVNLLDEVLKDYNTKKLIIKLCEVFKDNKIAFSTFLIAFLCALNVCVKLFKEIDLKLDRDYDEYIDLKDSLNNHLKNFNLKYQEQVFYFLANNLSNEVPFEPEVLSKARKLIPRIKEIFDLDKIARNYEKILLKKLCYSIFKYEGKILKVKKLNLRSIDSMILNTFNNILKSENISIYFSDKIIIIQILKKIILDKNKKNLKNILLLFNEINIADDNLLRNELKEHFNDYEIKIESSFLYNVNKEFYNNKYDLILSDEANLKNNINIINILDLNDIIENINNYILENHLKRRKASTN